MAEEMGRCRAASGRRASAFRRRACSRRARGTHWLARGRRARARASAHPRRPGCSGWGRRRSGAPERGRDGPPRRGARAPAELARRAAWRRSYHGLRRPPGSGGRPAGPARPVPDAASVADRGEDHAPRLADALLVGASATAYDPRGHAAHEERDAPLERQQGRLEPRPERIVAPGAIAADDAMAWHGERTTM